MTCHFSIIIPVYNVAPYLKECLDSVLSQTFTEWEAICIDDGSTDGSGVILDEYAGKDRRFRIFRQENQGVGAARNVGLDQASGKYVVFVDADDVIPNDWLLSFTDAIGKDKFDVVRANLVFWDDAGDSDCNMASQDYCRVIKRYHGAEEVMRWGLDEVLMNGYPVLNCIRREVIKEVRFPVSAKILEDCIFGAYVMTRAESVVVISNNGYRYRMREDSAIHRRTISANVVPDLIALLTAVGDLWEDIAKRIQDKNLIGIAQKSVAKFMERNLFDLGVGNRKRLRNPDREFGELADVIKGLIHGGALDIACLSVLDRFAFWLYLRFAMWRSLILLRFLNRPARLIHRRS